MKKFNVLLWDFNQDKLIYYDVLPHFRECYKNRVAASKKLDYDKNYYKVPKTYNEFREFIKNESQYQFWSRCEYEMICHGWPIRQNDYKLDVHEQVMMNIDVITEILFNELNNHDTKRKKETTN